MGSVASLYLCISYDACTDHDSQMLNPIVEDVIEIVEKPKAVTVAADAAYKLRQSQRT